MTERPAVSEVSERQDAAEAPAAEAGGLEQRVIDAMKTVFDPEIPVNIYELGLIYSLDVTPSGNVEIEMTLTTPACPVAGSLPGEVEAKVREVDGVNEVAVHLVWDPPWSPERMTEAAKLELGFL
jgi:FeS assembly SUF system protein